MDTTVWIVILVVLTLSAGGAVFYYRRRNKEVQQLFEQIAETAKQVPQQKKSSFILLMFKESIHASKKKDSNVMRRINDPKQLEVQLVQMASILKDRSKVTDKQMKRTLHMFDGYMAWEKKRAPKSGSKA